MRVLKNMNNSEKGQFRLHMSSHISNTMPSNHIQLWECFHFLAYAQLCLVPDSSKLLEVS